MSIHCPTNCLQKFKPLLCFNIGKSRDLMEFEHIYKSLQQKRTVAGGMLEEITHQIESSLFKGRPCIMKLLIYSEDFPNNDNKVWQQKETDEGGYKHWTIPPLRQRRHHFWFLSSMKETSHEPALMDQKRRITTQLQKNYNQILQFEPIRAQNFFFFFFFRG